MRNMLFNNICSSNSNITELSNSLSTDFKNNFEEGVFNKLIELCLDEKPNSVVYNHIIYAGLFEKAKKAVTHKKDFEHQYCYQLELAKLLLKLQKSRLAVESNEYQRLKQQIIQVLTRRYEKLQKLPVARTTVNTVSIPGCSFLLLISGLFLSFILEDFNGNMSFILKALSSHEAGQFIGFFMLSIIILASFAFLLSSCCLVNRFLDCKNLLQSLRRKYIKSPEEHLTEDNDVIESSAGAGDGVSLNSEIVQEMSP